MMEQKLQSNETVSDTFTSRFPFIAFLDVYTDGWYIEFAVDNPTVTDKSTLNWKRYHNQSIQQHGELARPLIYGLSDPFDRETNVLYRFNSGAQGATGFIKTVGLFTRT